MRRETDVWQRFESIQTAIESQHWSQWDIQYRANLTFIRDPYIDPVPEADNTDVYLAIRKVFTSFSGQCAG